MESDIDPEGQTGYEDQGEQYDEESQNQEGQMGARMSRMTMTSKAPTLDRTTLMTLEHPGGRGSIFNESGADFRESFFRALRLQTQTPLPE